MKRLLLLMIAVVALVGCAGGSKETGAEGGGGKKTRNVTDCVDCGGIVAPSAVSCPHCGSTDFTGSKAKAEAEAKAKAEAEAKAKAEAEAKVKAEAEAKAAAEAKIAANNPPPPTVPKLDIQLTHKGFKTHPESFVAVCNSAAMAIARYYPKRKFKPILIPKADHGNPVKLDRRGPNGETLIYLSLDSGRVWNQIAYQFSHEFTHILINHDQPGAGPNHWINEAFCEAASYQALKQMAKDWATHPPYPNWKGYAKHHSSYADKNLGKERARPDGIDFIPWLKKNEKALRLGKRYPNREIYKYVSYQLYQLIQREPGYLGALEYLNLGLRNPALSTHQYLARWKTVLPARHKPFADQVAAVFGYSLPK